MVPDVRRKTLGVIRHLFPKSVDDIGGGGGGHQCCPERRYNDAVTVADG
jgi:hypothetical protein